MALEQLSHKQRLQNFYDEEVMSCIHPYFELKVLANDTLFLFLDRNKHLLFHKFIQRTKCCQCLSPITTLSKQGTQLLQDQFNLLFQNDGAVQPGHEQKQGERIVQHCICTYSPNTTTEVTDRSHIEKSRFFISLIIFLRIVN